MLKIKLLTLFKEYAPYLDEDGCFEIEFKPGMTVQEALSGTNIAAAKINYNIFVNSRRKTADHILEDGDIIMVMPLLAGG